MRYAHPSNLIFLALISDTSVLTEGAEGIDGTEMAGLTPQPPLTVLTLMELPSVVREHAGERRRRILLFAIGFVKFALF